MKTFCLTIRSFNGTPYGLTFDCESEEDVHNMIKETGVNFEINGELVMSFTVDDPELVA